MNPVDIIIKKRDGGELTPAELDFFIDGITSGRIPVNTLRMSEAEAALLGDLPEDPEDDPIRGHADNFGYNQGYLLQILEKPPEGIEASAEYQIDCSEGLFDCAYVTERLEALQALARLVVASGHGRRGLRRGGRRRLRARFGGARSEPAVPPSPVV